MKTNPPLYACRDAVLAAQQAAAEEHPPAQRQAEFDLTHSAWLAEQNIRFEANGLWCDELRVW